jgi:integrase
MSVRKRRWWTRKQVAAWAAQKGIDPSVAKKELDALIAQARDLEAEAGNADEVAGLFGDFEPQMKWIVDYSARDGKQHIRTFDRKKDADAYQATVKVEVGKGTHVAPSQSPTVEQAAAAWINRANAEGRERGTVRQYQQHADLHIVPRIGKIKLANLTPKHVEDFRTDLLTNLSRPLARKVMTSFKSLLKVAKHGHVAQDLEPIRKTKREQRKLESGRDIPTPDEIRRLFEASAGDLKIHALLRTAAHTGLRASELRGLRWVDVDLTKHELHVRQRADRYNTIGDPKSESSARTVPLGPKLVAALRQWKLACPPGELVFPTGAGKIDRHANMLRTLAPTLKAAKVVKRNGAPKYALHAFRHFFASWCINPKDRGGRELPAKVVQTLLGHGSIVMTLDTYGHLFPRGDDRAELAAAEQAFG